MPIYAYRCASCGHAQDVLQKMSDPVLTVCPACSAAAYEKQLTAAGFQLKGSGWSVTDFRGGNSGAKKDDTAGDAAAPADKEKATDKPAANSADKPAEKPAEKAAQPAAQASSQASAQTSPAKAPEKAATPASRSSAPTGDA